MRTSGTTFLLPPFIAGGVVPLYLLFLIKVELWRRSIFNSDAMALGLPGMASRLQTKGLGASSWLLILILLITVGFAFRMRRGRDRSLCLGLGSLAQVAVCVCEANGADGSDLLTVQLALILLCINAGFVFWPLRAELAFSYSGALLVSGLVVMWGISGAPTGAGTMGLLQVTSTIPLVVAAWALVALCAAGYLWFRTANFELGRSWFWGVLIVFLVPAVHDLWVPVEGSLPAGGGLPRTQVCVGPANEFSVYGPGSSSATRGADVMVQPESVRELAALVERARVDGVQRLHVHAQRPEPLGLWTLPGLERAEFCIGCTILTSQPRNLLEGCAANLAYDAFPEPR